MSKYTTEVRYICESIAKNKDDSIDLYDIIKVVDLSWRDIINLDLAFNLCITPITNEFVIEHFNKIIPQIFLQHYTREIGSETYALWKFRLQNKLNTILPFYADMYETLTMKFNPLIDTDITHDSTGSKFFTLKNEGEKDSKTVHDEVTSHYKNQGETDTKNIDKYSETPQGTLENLESGIYLTNARINENNNDSVDTGSNEYRRDMTDITTTDTTATHDESDSNITLIKGKSSGVSYAKLITEYRKSLINIDQMFLGEFKDMFMLIY